MNNKCLELLDKWTNNTISFTEIYCGHYITNWLFSSNKCKKVMKKYNIDVKKYINKSDGFYVDKTKEIFNIIENLNSLLKNVNTNEFTEYEKNVFDKGYSKFSMVCTTLKLSESDNLLFMLELRQIFKTAIWEKIFPLLKKNKKKKINQLLNSLFIKIKIIFNLLRDSYINIELIKNELSFYNDNDMKNVIYVISNLIKSNYNIDEIYPKFNASFMLISEFLNVDFKLEGE